MEGKNKSKFKVTPAKDPSPHISMCSLLELPFSQSVAAPTSSGLGSNNFPPRTLVYSPGSDISNPQVGNFSNSTILYPSISVKILNKLNSEGRTIYVWHARHLLCPWATFKHQLNHC